MRGRWSVKRRGGAAAAAAVLVAAFGPSEAAWSAPDDPATVCSVTDDRVSELSGLVATASGYVAINDSNWDPDAIRIFFLNRSCGVTRTVGYPTAARDPEDLVAAPDGTLWIADIGDNFNAAQRRSTIALWRLAPGGKTPVIHRLTYPDGPHDAEALLLAADGTPVIVTKELSGPAGVYVPVGPLRPRSAEGVALRRAGEVRLPATTTANPFGSIGRRTITGAARSADGSRLTLRTYADAFEWDVVDGDVVKTITDDTSPRITALPNEPQGESIAYTVDGSAYLTVSDEPAGAVITRYGVPPRPSPSRTTDRADVAAAPGSAPRAGLTGMGVAALGLVIVGLGVFLARRRRRG